MVELLKLTIWSRRRALPQTRKNSHFSKNACKNPSSPPELLPSRGPPWPLLHPTLSPPTSHRHGSHSGAGAGLGPDPSTSTSSPPCSSPSSSSSSSSPSSSPSSSSSLLHQGLHRGLPRHHHPLHDRLFPFSLAVEYDLSRAPVYFYSLPNLSQQRFSESSRYLELETCKISISLRVILF